MPRNASPSANKKPPRTNQDTGRRTKKKVCTFCQEHSEWVDYKDVNLLRRFVSDRGKIKARRVSGCCVQHQREVAVAVKTARELALLPYSVRSASDRVGGRGGRGGASIRTSPPRSAEDATSASAVEAVTGATGVTDVPDEPEVDTVGVDESDEA
jgi:small subunit ribosomal protein S18